MGRIAARLQRLEAKRGPCACQMARAWEHIEVEHGEPEPPQPAPVPCPRCGLDCSPRLALVLLPERWQEKGVDDDGTR